MSATRLLVLGVVRMYGKAHGYQVRRELLSWSADKWANVAPGSIYHALKKMAAEDLLEEVTTDGEARGPDRTAYQLTPDGTTEFHRLLERALADSEETVQSAYRFAAAMTFLPALPRARAISLLSHRLIQLTGQRNNARHMLERGSGWGEPAHVHELYRLWVVNTEGMVGWLEELLRRLESGTYVMADDEGTAFGAPGTAETNQT